MTCAAAHLRDLPGKEGLLLATFNAMLDRLHAAFDAQQPFVAVASHELRTPLATIRGRSDVLLLSPTLDPEMRGGLVMVRDEAGRMGRLVANLLLLARDDEARTIDRRPIELDVLLEMACQARALAQGVTVTIGHEDQALVRRPGWQCRIQAPVSRLRRWRTSSNGSTAWTGHARRSGGAGLGLAIAHRIAVLQPGLVWRRHCPTSLRSPCSASSRRSPCSGRMIRHHAAYSSCNRRSKASFLLRHHSARASAVNSTPVLPSRWAAARPRAARYVLAALGRAHPGLSRMSHEIGSRWPHPSPFPSVPCISHGGRDNPCCLLPLVATIKAVRDLPCRASIRGTLGLETLWRGAVHSR
jgi:hypothetical protein